MADGLNDLYVVTTESERKKVSGIVVNTSFSAGELEVLEAVV